MAHYRAAVDTPREREDVFAYLSDFSTTREWDPGVVEAKRVNDGAVGEGTEFRLVAEFLGHKTALTYRIVEYDPPRAVTFRGENAAVISNDRITFEAGGQGTRITYAADLGLKGPLRVADPLLRLAFNRVGDRALAGLRHKLASTRSAKLSPLSGRSLDGRSYELPGDLTKPHNLGTDMVAVLVVGRGGRILAREPGGFEQDKAERLATALEPPAKAAAA